ncbi:dolichol-phosphate mannosyltransferase subunit 3 [Wallemia mellicola CBS 633.66]|uniref:Dolichol-phosphate mannosyltransferase subunit 3 n=1 Tax=Wallemia mellicola (strain ATCC MYA-4683 / CBS 633.66) TaxID=671144 RepID=I4YJP3_WALMC|nr:dolichol-phosphate mannosyltransferase subunit 3 [Wallemia mellicola CBS 633.66]EIM24185.1 dolichol-phosphate mannosyltransferase subunit 3 [Wallemia mellicola CBS 633.66]|eukprot:XP_006956005.1 dolichol-phosphate mannosyltransferase subunit 3 [Wallemia mellicola CBS 633.66]
MTGLKRFILYGGIISLAYILSLFKYVKIPLVNQEYADITLPFFPYWALITFGSYSLASIGFGLFTFKDCPEAYNELLSEITQAKDELRARGVDVD